MKNKKWGQNNSVFRIYTKGIINETWQTLMPLWESFFREKKWSTTLILRWHVCDASTIFHVFYPALKVFLNDFYIEAVIEHPIWFSDDPCGNKPCGNNQTCVVTDTGFVCECMMGYQGDCNKCEGKGPWT